MAEEQIPRVVAEQQEIVWRYALQLRETACTTAQGPAEPRLRRCYELLNQCAMELAEINRRAGRRGAVTTY